MGHRTIVAHSRLSPPNSAFTRDVILSDACQDDQETSWLTIHSLVLRVCHSWQQEAFDPYCCIEKKSLRFQVSPIGKVQQLMVVNPVSLMNYVEV